MISSALYRFRATPLPSSAGILTPDSTWNIEGKLLRCLDPRGIEADVFEDCYTVSVGMFALARPPRP